jgi:formylglycine-generating enzyme required for sulfatase activity
VPPGMAFVPPGEASDAGGVAVGVDGFFIDRTEVTNAQYMEFCQNRGWRLPPYANAVDEAGQSMYAALSPAEVPVTLVTFFDAQAYAAAAGKSLPTSAQWIRATVALDGSYPTYPWGDYPEAGAANVADAGAGDGRYGPSVPGEYEEDHTAWGCADMAGNVREWTRSIAPAEPGKPAGEIQAEDDGISVLSRTVVTCGSAYGLVPVPLHTPSAVPARHRDIALGFRCVKECPQTVEGLRKLVQRAS